MNYVSLLTTQQLVSAPPPHSRQPNAMLKLYSVELRYSSSVQCDQNVLVLKVIEGNFPYNSSPSFG